MQRIRVLSGCSLHVQCCIIIIVQHMTARDIRLQKSIFIEKPELFSPKDSTGPGCSAAATAA